MSVLTALPRKTAALQYKALRLPYTVLEKQVVGRLAEDSKLRLGYERALGRLDERAGRLTGDADLSRRGEALQRRAQVLETRTEVLTKAEQLEAKAQSRKQEAEQTLQAEKDRAEQQRREAARGKQEGVAEALADEEADKRRVAAEADAKEKAEKERIERQAASKQSAAEQRKKTQEQRIEVKLKADTAAPKAQLDDAVELVEDADQKRSRAERMGELADAEADTRRAEREPARVANK